MIEVYKTNVKDQFQAQKVLNYLYERFNGVTINFDLDDCDKILRVAGIRPAYVEDIIDDMNKLGFYCQLLD